MTLLDLMPETDPLMRQAWIDCLRWAVGEPKILDAFQEDTGYVPPRNALDAMIDEATGASKEAFLKFVRWFNENIWGGEEDESLA